MLMFKRITTAMITMAAATASLTGSALQASVAADEAAILKALEDSCRGFKVGDLEASIAPYHVDSHIFDMPPPQQRNYAELKETLRKFISSIATPPSCGYRDVFIKVYGDNAYAHYIMPVQAQLKDGRKVDFEGRATDIFERSGGKWLIVHEHLSVPVDMITGLAELKPTSAR